MKNAKANLIGSTLKLAMTAALFIAPQIVTAQSLDKTKSQQATVNPQPKNAEKTSLNLKNTNADQVQKSFLMKQSALDRALFRHGGADSGGGDEVGLSFQQAVQSAATKLSSSMDQKTKDLLAATIDSSKYVVVTEKLKVKVAGETQESVAINVPNNKIVYVNRDRWTGITDQFQREKIAGHEVLSLMGLESTGDYHISSKLLKSNCDDECSKYPTSAGMDIVSLKNAWDQGSFAGSSALGGKWAVAGMTIDRTIDATKGVDEDGSGLQLLLGKDLTYHSGGFVYPDGHLELFAFDDIQNPITGANATSVQVNAGPNMSNVGPYAVQFNLSDGTTCFSRPISVSALGDMGWYEMAFTKTYNCRLVKGFSQRMICKDSFGGQVAKNWKIDNITLEYLLLEKQK